MVTSPYLFRVDERLKKRYQYLVLNNHLHRAAMNDRLRNLFAEVVRQAEQKAGLKLTGYGLQAMAVNKQLEQEAPDAMPNKAFFIKENTNVTLKTGLEEGIVGDGGVANG